MDATDKSDWVEINIEGPLPMGHAGALMQLIGAAWPNAVIQTDPGRGRRERALCMKVPPSGARTISKVEAQNLASQADRANEETEDSMFLGFDKGMLLTAPPEELCLALGEVGHALFSRTEGAINYVEWEIKTSQGERYVLCVAKTEEQTPGSLKTKAEAEIERLKKLLDNAGVAY